MMSAEEQRDYLEAVDEMRRLQTVHQRPFNPTQLRKIREQETVVDEFTTRFLERLTSPATLPASSSAGAAG